MAAITFWPLLKKITTAQVRATSGSPPELIKSFFSSQEKFPKETAIFISVTVIY